MIKRVAFLLMMLGVCVQAQTPMYFPIIYVSNTNFVPALSSNAVIIAYGAQTFISQQANDFLAISNPANSAQMIAVFDGLDSGGVSKVGTAYCWVTNPYTWFLQSTNPIFQGVGSGNIRDDSFFYDTAIGKYVLFYTEITSLSPVFHSVICRATSPVGADGFSTISFTPDPDNPKLSYLNDETTVSQGDVLKLSPTLWKMLYAYRTLSLTEPGLREAYSPNGSNAWVSFGQDAFTPYANSFYEFHHSLFVGTNIVTFCEMGLDSGLGRWLTTMIVATNIFATNKLAQLDLNTLNQTGWAFYTNRPFGMIVTPDYFYIGAQGYFAYCCAELAFNYGTNNYSTYIFSGTQPLALGGSTISIPKQVTPLINFTNFTDSFIGSGDLASHFATSESYWFTMDVNATIGLSSSGAYFSEAAGGPSEYYARFRPLIPTNQTVSIVVGKGTITSNPQVGVILAATVSPTLALYEARYIEGTGFIVYRFGPDFNTFYQVGTAASLTLANNDTMTATYSVSGSTVTITMFQNGVQKLQVTDSAGTAILNGGYVGVYLFSDTPSPTSNYTIKSMTAH